MAPKYAKFHGESDGNGPEARNGPKPAKDPNVGLVFPPSVGGVGVDLPQPEMVPRIVPSGDKETLFPKPLNPHPGQDLRGNPLNPPGRRLRRRPQGRFVPLEKGV